MRKLNPHKPKVFEVVSKNQNGGLVGTRVRKGGAIVKPNKARPKDFVEMVTPQGMSVVRVGDRVLAQIIGGSKAKVVRRLEQSESQMLGVMSLDKNTTKNEDSYRVDTLGRTSRPIFLSGNNIGNAKVGDLVEVSVKSGVSQVEKVHGHVDSPETYWLIAATEHDLPKDFGEEVVSEIPKVSEVDVAKGRVDWRDEEFVTIDPSDARDHDDAVCAKPDTDKKNPGGYVVKVAISDVSLYVRPGTAIDKEAMKRGNSVYFANHVIPMLPEILSNDLCSLHQDVDRPAVAVSMRFNKSGKKIDHQFKRVLIRSRESLAYEQAEKKPEVTKFLWEAYEVVNRGREARAPLELDVPERKIKMKKGKVEGVTIPVRLEAHRLIEEFMIQANVCAAETLERANPNLIYRVHDSPSAEKVAALKTILKGLGLGSVKLSGLRAYHLNGILERAGEYSEFLGEIILRAQSQAEYNTLNIGHFGLNLNKYAHFTSPIRRYADLTIHRLLVGLLAERHISPDNNADNKNLSVVAEHLSHTERRAMRAERQTIDRLVSHYMSDKIDAEFSARINGVTRSGVFVSLTDTGASGFAPVSPLGWGAYNMKTHTLKTEMGVYQLGDNVDVRLVEASPVNGGLRFELLSKGRSVTKMKSKKKKNKNKTTKKVVKKNKGGKRRNNSGRRK